MAIYRSVRALDRGMAVLFDLSVAGPSTPRSVAERIGLDRATVYRLLHTLADTDYVAVASGGRYRLTFKTRELGCGYRVQDVLLSELQPALHKLHETAVWPSAFARLDGERLVIEETTMSISPYAAHSLPPGTELSMLRTAAGRAILMALTNEEQTQLVDRWIELEAESGSDFASRERVLEIVNRSQREGFAYNVGDYRANMSGIALPVMHRGRPIGAVNIVFFTKGLSIQTAVDTLLSSLRRCVQQLERALSDEERRAAN